MASLLDYARRGRNDWWLYLLVLLAGFIAAVTVGTALTLALQLSGSAPPDLAGGLTHPDRPAIFFVGTGVSFLLLVVGLASAAWLIQKKSPLDIIGNWRWSLFGLGLAGWAVAQGLAELADYVISPGAFRLTASSATLTLAAVSVPALVIQTFAEEFIFRGYITQGLLLALRRPWPTAIVSGLLFGAAHWANGVPQTANAVMFGVAAAYIAIRTGGLAATFGIHLANNVLGAVAFASADDVFHGVPAIVTVHAPSLVWWDIAVQVGLLAAAVAVARAATAPKPNPAA
jgi:membrane protease YdiL (CAAX protease family)